MVRLSRETRFALVPEPEMGSGKANNSWAGWPSTNLIVPQLRLQVIVSGEPDSSTGYLCNIKIIDDLLRNIVTKKLIPNYDGTQTAEQLIRVVVDEVHRGWNDAVVSDLDRNGRSYEGQTLPVVDLVCLHVTPFLRYTIGCNPPSPRSDSLSATETIEPNESPDGFSNRSSATMIELTQQFEFSAAHRLHCHDLSDAANRQLFGKCNNPEGHGHNYVVEVSVAAQVDSDQGQVVSLDQFEAKVKELVIDRLDHKHLNRDVDYFSKVNPSVENIAVAIFGWLNGQFGSTQLTRVKVFETPKTWAEFSG